MNIHSLREAQVRFENRMEEIKEARKELHLLRASFVKYFSPNRISTMGIDTYVEGAEPLKKGYNFCYTLERKLGGLGSFVGATAYKFGVYYGRTKTDESKRYRFTKKYGDTYQEAFNKVKETILDLLKAGKSENVEALVSNNLSPMFKGKILSTYYPERYLNVFSPDHLDYFLTKFDLDTRELVKSDPIYKREELIKFKNQDTVMRKWPVDLFSHFLYNEYPGRPPQKNTRFGFPSTQTMLPGTQPIIELPSSENPDFDIDPLTEYRIPNFPINPIAEFIDLNVLPPNQTGISGYKGGGKGCKPNYERDARILKILGDRGEKIVMDLEINRLKEAGKLNLANKVKRVSLESDSYGYDILSYETDGAEKYIEVKATRSKVGPANFFITANELRTARESENYYIYMVYDVISKTPKVWAIENPFNIDNTHTIKTPMSFRVTINAK